MRTGKTAAVGAASAENAAARCGGPGRDAEKSFEKDYNVEIIRVISCIMVIVIHVTNYYCRAWDSVPEEEYLFSLILDTAARVSVPCFFMISGAFLLALQDTVKDYGNRLKRFLPVLIVWSAVYYFYNRFCFGMSYDLREVFSTPVEKHLWYLYAMIPVYLVLPFLQMIFRNMDRRWEKIFLIVTGGAAVLTYLLARADERVYYDLPLVGDRVYTFYVFAGYFLYRYRDRIKIGQKTLAAVFVFCAALTAGITWYVTKADGVHCEIVLQYGNPLIMLMSAAFFLFILRLRGGKITLPARRKRWIDLFSRCSFGIYLIHIMFLTAYKKMFLPQDLSAWIAVPAVTIGLAAVSFLCVLILRKCGIGRKIT